MSFALRPSRAALSCAWPLAAALLVTAAPARADENLFGYLSGAETLPQGSWEAYQYVTQRSDKGQGHYRAMDYKTEVEWGWTHRLTVSGAIKAMSIDTSGLLIDGYLPADKEFGPKLSGFELGLKYNFLSPAKDDFGLAGKLELSRDWIDPHSGQDKRKVSVEASLLAQKYFMEGQVVWVGNLGLESTYARRSAVDNLPAGFDWSLDPETEIEIKAGTGLSWRFAPNWYVGAEVAYEAEYETEVGQERWSVFAGPTLHYGGQKWWATLTWFPQVRGGGEQYDGQPAHYHLIEKTRQEVRVKVGYNF